MNMAWSEWQMKKISLLIELFHENFRSKTKSEMQNNVLMHREGLKGQQYVISFDIIINTNLIYICMPSGDVSVWTK